VPNTFDTENVQATYEAGVLKVELQKRAEAKPKQIKVAVGSPKPVEAANVEEKTAA
jgi:HSP20 family protein